MNKMIILNIQLIRFRIFLQFEIKEAMGVATKGVFNKLYILR